MTVVSTSAPSLLTVITVYADYHETVMARAAASVAAQTIPVDHLVYKDVYRDGPAVGRNRLAREASTPFITFLDADDWLMPEFAARMLLTWQPGHYVYCDWQRDGVPYALPEEFPQINSYQIHTNTCVIHRETFLALGGYRENIDFEDTDFYFRAMARGVCGIRCPHALLHYSAGGQRSSIATERHQQLNEIYRRYHAMGCGCNQTISPQSNNPQGEQMPGDTLVSANWQGNRIERGKITGRRYPRTGWGKLFWADPRDAAASNGLFVIQEESIPAEDVDVDTIKADIQRLLNAAS